MTDGRENHLARRRVAPALASQTAYLLRVAFAHAGDLAAAILPPGMSPRFYGVLATLNELGPQSQRELSKLLHVNRTMMVALIDSMEEAGLVERRRNPADRRSYALEPTDKGRRVLPELTAGVKRAESALAAPLTAAEHQRLQALLRAVVISGEKHREIPAGLAERTGYLLTVAHLRQRIRLDELLRGAGIAVPQFGTLATIEQSGPLSQQRVAEQLGLTGTAVLQIIDRLEADGLVERRRNPADRRSYALELTRRGKATLAEAHVAVERAETELAEILGGRSQERELHGLLQKMLQPA
jgi:DNA-binding MarR family transcriptional regulator